VLTVVERLEHRRVGAQELVHRDAVDALHLVQVRRHLARRTGPQQHRRNDITRARDEVVEAPKHIVQAELQAHLFDQLAQGRLFGRLAGVDAPARQRPLAGMAAQPVRAARQHQRGACAPGRRCRQPGQVGTVAFVGDGHRHGRRVRRRTGGRMHGKGLQVPDDALLQLRVTLHGAGPPLTTCCEVHAA
jgi:hypothetical protein